MNSIIEWQEIEPGTIWVRRYPIRLLFMNVYSRTTIIRLSDGTLFIHSPCEMDIDTVSFIKSLGVVSCIVAPGSFHFSFVESAHQAFPDAEIWICPGVEIKNPRIHFDWFLADRPAPRWVRDFDQVLIRGNRFITEVAFFHKKSNTLILVDLIEYLTDSTLAVGWQLKFWWKLSRMWNNPKPAPEYQMGWKDRYAAAMSLKRLLSWNFDRIIIAHGDLILANAKSVAHKAWARVLSANK
jgi:hypothetical protein